MKLILNDINKTYVNEVIINKFSYIFKTGKIYYLLGNNGSGKTTLLKIIATLLTPDSGAIKKDEKELKSDRDFKLYRSAVSLLINFESSLINDLTILQNIKFFLGINNFTYSECCSYIDELIYGFGLETQLRKPVKYLSKGTKQKAALIIAIMRKTDIILLDEPFDGLDAASSDFLIKTLQKVAENSIVIMTMPKEIENMSCEKIILY